LIVHLPVEISVEYCSAVRKKLGHRMVIGRKKRPITAHAVLGPTTPWLNPNFQASKYPQIRRASSPPFGGEQMTVGRHAKRASDFPLVVDQRQPVDARQPPRCSSGADYKTTPDTTGQERDVTIHQTPNRRP
jgi:hypothetical protein